MTASDPLQPLAKHSQFVKLSLQITVCLLLGACGFDDWKELGDGYVQAETDAYNTWIVLDRETVVDSNVTTAIAIDEYIVGLREKPERFISHDESEISSDYGYFVLDKSTGVLLQGLSETEMRQVFEDNGWNFQELRDGTL